MKHAHRRLHRRLWPWLAAAVAALLAWAAMGGPPAAAAVSQQPATLGSGAC